MRYVVNNLQQPIFLSDVRKVIPYDPTGKKVFAFSDEIFERSAELRANIGNGAALDVSQQYNQQIEAARAKGVPVSPYFGVELQPQQQVFASMQDTGRPAPFTVPQSKQSVMIDIDGASRALGASDAAAHAAHINQGIRPNGETGFLVDPYDDPNARVKAMNSRTAYLVDNDSKANPNTDPRFYQNNSGRFNPLAAEDVAPVNLAPIAQQASEPQPPMQQLYQTAQRNMRPAESSHEHGKNDPSWGQNSALLAQRRSESPTSGRPHDHAFNPTGYEPLDPRIMANAMAENQPQLNPLLVDDVETSSVNQNPDINPLADEVLFTPKRKRIYDDPEELEITELGDVPVPKKRRTRKTTKPTTKPTTKATTKSGGKKGRPRKKIVADS